MRGGNLGTDVNVFMLQRFAAVVGGLVFAVGVGSWMRWMRVLMWGC